MTLLSASQLAQALNVTKTRVSQYVREGKLEGCYTGHGRARRFDLDKVALALGRSLHPGQMMGNGADTRKALTAITRPSPFTDAAARPIILPNLEGPAPAEETDSGIYEGARAQKALEEVRKLRRANAEAEGKYVLATEAERQISRAMAQEIAHMEAFLKEASRRVADQLGLDARTVRTILANEWRARRVVRSQQLSEEADTAEMSDAEREVDI